MILAANGKYDEQTGTFEINHVFWLIEFDFTDTIHPHVYRIADTVHADFSAIKISGNNNNLDKYKAHGTSIMKIIQ